MPHSVGYDAGAGIVRLTIQGEITVDVAKKAAAEVVTVAKAANCYRILSDFREAVLRVSTMEIFKLPDLIGDLAAAEGLDVNRFRRAGIVASDFEDFSFFETVSRNRHQKVKIFQDAEEAVRWLTGD